MKKNLYKEKNTTYTKRIADVIEFERITVIRTKYTNEHPTNNLIAINYSGDIVWEIDTGCETFRGSNCCFDWENR